MTATDHPPISRSADHGGDTTVFTVTGEVDASQVLGAIVAFLRTAPTPYVIWDFRNGSLRRMASSDLRMIINRAGPLTGVRAGGRTAIICATDVDFGLSRMFQTFALLNDIPFEIHVFREMDAAEAWLYESKQRR